MSVLPVGYFNKTNAYFEKNTTPDAINNIIGTDGIIATRTDDTVTLSLNGTITTPLVIASPDGTKELTISEVNDGEAFITNLGDIVISVSEIEGNPVSNVIVQTEGSNNNPASLTVQSTATLTDPGTGPLAIIALSNNEQTYRILLPSEAGPGYSDNDLQIISYPQGVGVFNIFNSSAQGNAIILGSSSTQNGTLLQIDGSQGLGQVFDNLYNRPPPVQFVYNTEAPQTLGNTGAIVVDTDNVIYSVVLESNSGSGSIFLDNPGQTALGDTYGIRFTASPGMAVNICNPSPSQQINFVDGISASFVPVVNTTYWFSCYGVNLFRYVGKMEAIVP
jgi:hypothetical protein